MQSGIVFDIMHFSTRDGPGIRTTVFLKGCPLHCAWCHNPESQSRTPQLMLRPNLCIGCLACLEACPHGAIGRVDGRLTYNPERCELCGRCLDACAAGARELVGRPMTSAAVLAEIEKDRVFFDESGGGVTFSGGEALLQYDFLVDLLTSARAAGIHTALDTSGYGAPERFDTLLPLVDLVLYDIKSMDDAVHREYTGVTNQPILANLRRLSSSGVPFYIRYPFIPGVNDSDSQMHALGQLACKLPGLLGIELLPFHQIGLEKYRRLQIPYRLPDLLPPTQDALEASANVLRSYNVEVSIGG